MATPTKATSRIARGLIRHAAVTTTHQALVFDALDKLVGIANNDWRRLFWRHAHLLSLGADAPDVDFRDFKNHLLFPANDFWGGAPVRAQCWYRNLVTALKKGEWQNATYCAGVLSHYVADCAYPLHTAQTREDNDIYGAVGRVVWLTYRDLIAPPPEDSAAAPVPPFVVSSAADLDTALRAAATDARADYDALIAGFDIRRSLDDPASGLDAPGRAAMSRFLWRATGLIASVISSAISEAAVAVPETSLLMPTAQTLLVAPVTAVSNLRQRSIVTRSIVSMVAELTASGHLDATLPEAMRIKRDLFAKEVLGRDPRGIDGAVTHSRGSAGNVVAFPPGRLSTPRENDGDGDAEVIDLRRQRRIIEQARPAPRNTAADPVRQRADVLRTIAGDLTNDDTEVARSVTVAPASA